MEKTSGFCETMTSFLYVVIFFSFCLVCNFLNIVIMRLFRMQYKTPIAEAYDYFRKSMLDKIARWKK